MKSDKYNTEDKIFELKNISIKGAREHNLKNIDLDIERDKLIVITGLSGSGKSSLAFDTLYAEGQRRYVECLSPYAKQFIGIHKKPDVDKIEGLSPAISIEQKSISHNPRSTVGTTTEIYDYYRLLFAKIGTQYSVEHNVPVVRFSQDQIFDSIYEKFRDNKIQILAPVVRGRKGHYRELFEQLIKQGFTRVRIDGSITRLQEGMKLSRYQIHDIELVVDRVQVTEEMEHRIYESLELAIQRGEGLVSVLYLTKKGTWEEDTYSTNYACPVSGTAYEPLAPNMFSFNSPYGACKTCHGIGSLKKVSLNKLIPDKEVTLDQWQKETIERSKFSVLNRQINGFLKAKNIDSSFKIKELKQDDFQALFFGDGSEIDIDYQFKGGSKRTYHQKFFGIIPTLEYNYKHPPSTALKRHTEKFMSSATCPDCKGGRLKQSNLFVRIRDNNIHDISSMDVTESIRFFKKLKDDLNEKEKKIANVILKEIITRLNFLNDVGLSYITLDRSLNTLSGGESQRIRLASQIGSQLVGIMYILDEPSIGLHQHDNNKLINSLKKLRDLGNTVIVVEHDRAMIESSDILVDMGPAAGVHGGEIIMSIYPEKLSKNHNSDIQKSLTAQYLLDRKMIEVPEERRKGSGKSILLKHASGNNLRNVDLDLPLGKFICVTGMSGSGKSTLINDTLYPILAQKHKGKLADRTFTEPYAYKSIEGTENIDKIIEIDQAPIGRTPRSNPATYTGLFTLIRDFFAILPESKIRGYKPGRFSFNVKGGRCEECQGAGLKRIEMNFLADVYVRCDVCDGRRYNRETLQVKYNDKSIADVLDMTVNQAYDFFSELPKIRRKLKAIKDVGLGYIKLGQQAPTLSGGEAQRVKLATELSKRSTGKTLYLLDEPTTGLHFEDIKILLELLNQLVDKGNTVVIIEHNLDVIKYADWIIDLGPKGGIHGGDIIAEGTPEQISKIPSSYTGQYLKRRAGEGLVIKFMQNLNFLLIK